MTRPTHFRQPRSSFKFPQAEVTAFTADDALCGAMRFFLSLLYFCYIHIHV